MRQSAALARQYGVQLHTHLAETEDEVDFTIQQFGKRPVAYMEEVDWIGSGRLVCTFSLSGKRGNWRLC